MYEFSIASFFVGILIVILGIVFVRYYQWVADNFGAGVGSYERYRLYAILTVVAGLLVMVNLHIMILKWIFSAVFSQ